MKNIKTLCLCLIIGLALNGCTTDTILSDSDLFGQETTTIESDPIDTTSDISDDASQAHRITANIPLFKLPEYEGKPYAVINDNIPFFTEDEITNVSYEAYLPLDDLDRVQPAIACLGLDTMPAEGEERGEIGMVRPAGWHTVKYPEVIPDLYLYNRCHLIGWQLGAENDNELNLTTGTRYLNTTGMLPFENAVADYIRNTGNHVMYRISPVFVQDNLICHGILMEALSVETTDISFCVYCFNVQPGICIDYATGDSWLDETVSQEPVIETPIPPSTEDKSYVLNTNTMKIHLPDCQAVSQIAEHNRQDYMGDINDLLSQGYTPCGYCHPE